MIVDNPDKSKLVLEKTHLFANIENSLAEIHFTTEYKNSSDHPIELLYQFPTDQRFTVTRVKAVIDEREILTKIMEKEEAKETYSDAVASGNTAVKVSFDEEVADILNINIGQLQPQKSAVITVELISLLSSSYTKESMKGFYSF